MPSTADESRFATWPRLPAIGLLLATAALIVYGLFAGLQLVDRTEGVASNRTDAALYEGVAKRVADGENYYRAVATEHRERGYPLRPFVTVREPTLAYATAAVGGPIHMRDALAAVAFVAVAAFVWRLESTAPGRLSWWLSAVLVAVTVAPLIGRMQAMTHEIWVGMLILLSLAVRGHRRFAASVGLGLVVVLVRELALPYLSVMAFLAWHEGRRREAYAWMGAVGVFAVAYATHAALVLQQSGTSDIASEGWLRFGGWPFVLDLLRRSTFLAILPGWVAAAVIPLAFVGWISRRTPLAGRVVLTIGMFVCAFMIIGRPENSYWGIIFVLLVIPGLAFAPVAIWQLGKRALST